MFQQSQIKNSRVTGIIIDQKILIAFPHFLIIVYTIKRALSILNQNLNIAPRAGLLRNWT